MSRLFDANAVGRQRFAQDIRIPKSENPMMEYLLYLGELDKMLKLGGTKVPLVAPLTFQGCPPDVAKLLDGQVPLWDDEATLGILAVIPAPRTFYIDDWNVLEEAVLVFVDRLRDERVSLPPLVPPWSCFRVLADVAEWSPIIATDLITLEYIQVESRRLGFICADDGKGKFALFDEHLVRWHVRNPKTGEMLSDHSTSATMTKFALFDSAHDTFSSVDIENSQSLDSACGMLTFAPLLAAEGFLALLNHRSVKRAPMVDPERPINRQQRRATGYVERQCERIILGPRTSVERAVTESLAGVNTNGFTPRWVRRHARQLRSGRWVRVRENFKASKALSPEERARLKELTRPKDYDASALVWHTAHDRD